MVPGTRSLWSEPELEPVDRTVMAFEARCSCFFLLGESPNALYCNLSTLSLCASSPYPSDLKFPTEDVLLCEASSLCFAWPEPGLFL